MPRGSRIVDINGIVHDVARFVVAIAGEAKEIGKGWIAATGTVRQFWPPTTVLGDAIIMTTDTEESYANAALGEAPPQALCNYDARTGRIVLSTSTGERYVQAIGPVPRQTGLYLWKFDIVSGTITATDPEGSWVDVFSGGSIGVKEYYLQNDNAAIGQEVGEATVSVAKDDGAGAPEAGTEVSKTVNFISEILGSNLTMTTIPWVLSTIRVNERAQSLLLVGPSGTIYGYEGNIETERETYAQTWNPAFMVQVDVVSGAVDGSATGVMLTTDQVRTWDVDAVNPGDEFAAEVNVTVTDGVSSVVKNVTFYARQDDESAQSELTPAFTPYSEIKAYFIWYGIPAAFQDTRADLFANANGEVDAASTHDVSGLLDNLFPQDWNTSAPTVPDPENFEVKLTVVSGDFPSGDLVGVWLNLSTNRNWYLEYKLGTGEVKHFTVNVKSGLYDLWIQEVGRPETTLVKRVFMEAKVWANDPGEEP